MAGMSGKRTPSDDELALLSAFLDGELSEKEEATLLDQLSQRPDLQDALDDLAALMADAHAALVPVHGAGDAVGGLIAARVMAEIDPGALPAAPEWSREAAETLASLAKDGAATAPQDRRLDELLQTPALADAAASLLAAADVARAAVDVSDGAVARGLQTLPEHVLARVERTERGWALATGAVDGQLSDAEVNELAGLCGADDDVYAALAFEVRYARHAGEALRAATDSPAFLQHAEKAGAAALQAIAALQTQREAQEQKQLQQLQKSSTSTSTSTSGAPSLLDRARALFGQGLAPLFAASAALVLFVVVGKNEPATTRRPDGPTGTTFAALQQAFVDAAAPIVYADNRAVESGPLAVLGDNTADVEAIDATGTTMVFSTAESNITIIWVDGLGTDSNKEQGT